MPKRLPLVALFALLAGCVTINVYFPAAAAQEAAKKVIGNVIGADTGTAPAPASSAPNRPPAAAFRDRAPEDGVVARPLALRVLDGLVPAANAAEPQPDLTVSTPRIQAIQARMHDRFGTSLKALLASGAVGLTHNGDVAVRDPSKVPLSRRAQVNQVVAAENADRAALYKQIAIANGHPEWESRMREAFAKQWINMARPGWYYQDASGNWKQK